MGEASGLINSAVNWNRFDGHYYAQYGLDPDGNPLSGFQLVPEDKALNRAFIETVEQHPELYKQLGTVHRILDVCSGGVLRTSMLMAPLAAPENSVIELADIGKVQLSSMERALDNGRAGDPGAWLAHAQDLAKYDTKGWWENALQTVFDKGQVVPLSIFDLPKREYGAGTTGFGPESLTGERAEWELAVTCLARAIEEGGPFAMHYVIGSNGWDGFPAVPIYPRDVERVLRGEVRILSHTTTPASGKTRKQGDKTHYSAFGLVMGIVESQPRH